MSKTFKTRLVGFMKSNDFTIIVVGMPQITSIRAISVTYKQGNAAHSRNRMEQAESGISISCIDGLGYGLGNVLGLKIGSVLHMLLL